ncbi:MAG: DUF4260 domain-containing protein [Chloroflexi bacterium]|nr:DUF4260 domain-containing protein [Chloroflexota bacterium]
MPGVMLRLEGTAVFIFAALAYGRLDFSWLTFVLALLWPDVAFVVYALNPRWGSVIYNLLHSYPLPLALTAVAYLLPWSIGLQIGLIWLAHIGMDRTFGYGLKYLGQFKQTHLNRV